METARVFGILLKQGWRPRRTIVIASCDAEEYGLMGSFEFTEKWQKTLFANAVAYFNLDACVKGGDKFDVKGSPAFKSKITEIARTINIERPEGTATLYSIWNPADITPLGSGSDFTSFIQRLGIASFNFDLEPNLNYYDSVYHSNYDSFYWVENFGDPGFLFHKSMVNFYGSLVLEVADNRILPFDYRDYAALIQKGIADLEAEANRLNFFLVFTNLKNSAQNFSNVANATIAEIAEAAGKTELEVRGLNDRLMYAERAFLSDSFVSGSLYFLHVLSAPSDTDSYSGGMFPAVYEAFAEGDGAKAQFLMDRIALIINGAADYLAYNFVN